MSEQPLEFGNAPYGIKWKVMQDLVVDLENHKNFTIIATRGAGRYIAPDVICDSMDEFQAELDSGKYLAYLPLFILAHGSVHLSVREFYDKWDSGQCGFAALTKEDAASYDPEDLESQLRNAVEEYDNAANGNVVGYVVEQTKSCACGETDKTEVLDSCWGYVLSGWGGMDDFVKHEVLPQVNYWIDKFSQAESAKVTEARSDD